MSVVGLEMADEVVVAAEVGILVVGAAGFPSEVEVASLERRRAQAVWSSLAVFCCG